MTNILFYSGVVLFVGALIYCQIGRMMYKKACERSEENLALLDKCSHQIAKSEKLLKDSEQHRKTAESTLRKMEGIELKINKAMGEIREANTGNGCAE